MANNYLSLISTKKKNLTKEVASLTNTSELEELKIKYLGRQGEINSLFKILPIKENPEIAKEVNIFKQFTENLFLESSKGILDKVAPLDLTIPSDIDKTGSLHLISKAIEEIETIFTRLGFVRRRYPEVDTDWYYAEGLNIPKDHPARDDQETFYLSENVVLTAHTSNGQLHEMDRGEYPIRMINIGKTYRRQADTTHNFMFHQFEGLVIDKDISIANLIAITEYFAHSYFGPERKIRLRPHHFQFTEPSFEIDISCDLCQGTGKVNDTTCKMCKTGWLELGGAGMVHPNVLKNGKVDSQYTGFAFGWGVERVLLMKSGLNIPDLRLLFSDDLRFLSQFK